MSYTSIGQAIKELLDEITEIQAVFNYAETEFTQWPTARVYIKGHNNEFATTAANRRRYIFSVDLFYRTNNAQESERIIRQTADLIITKIESNPTLKGTCDFAQATTGQVQFTESPVPMQYILFEITANKYINR